jgi:dTDP-4-dehydrorhamnose reductase
MNTETILMTGGSGRLGTELRSLLPDIIAPLECDMDIIRPSDLAAAIEKNRPSVFLHAAAYTDVAGAEVHRQKCWEINVHGTRNVVQAIAERDILLIHISTDYVFEGTRGMYAEDDPPGPVRNYYALSKLAAEEVARTAARHLVIRTSFRPREWPHPVAFTDVHTSQDYVDIIAPEIALAVRRCREIPYATLHIATHRKSAYELARSRRPDVQPAGKSQAKVDLPDDVSLDISRWQSLKAAWGVENRTGAGQ